MKRIGGAHFHATARFAAGPAGGAPNVVTTTTDVWVDRAGNYRFASRTIATVAARWCSTGASSPLRYAMGR